MVLVEIVQKDYNVYIAGFAKKISWTLSKKKKLFKLFLHTKVCQFSNLWKYWKGIHSCLVLD